MSALTKDVIPHPVEVGLLQLSQDVMQELLCKDPIESHLSVENKPFARWVFFLCNKYIFLEIVK